MLSWYGISAAFGIICLLFTILVIAYLVWNTKQLIKQIDDKWKNVKISASKPNEHRLRAVRVPGERNVMQLQLGGTVSSTSSVHPTRETWLNIQNSIQTPPTNATERPTMRDLQDMFAPAYVQPQEEDTPSTAAVDGGVYVTAAAVDEGVYVTAAAVDGGVYVTAAAGDEGVYVTQVSMETPTDSSV